MRFSPHGDIIACTAGDAIDLWSVSTGYHRDALLGHRGNIPALSFSRDGRILASGGQDGTIVLWDMEPYRQQSSKSPETLSSADWNLAWHRAGGDDAVAAYEAMQRLIASPQQTALLLKQRLRPATTIDASRLKKFLADLDSSRFDLRERATRELIAVGDQAEEQLKHAGAAAKDAPETQRRLRQILERIAAPAGTQLQALRGIEVLEDIGTSQARELLQTLACGAAKARSTLEAQAALRRLSQQQDRSPR